MQIMEIYDALTNLAQGPDKTIITETATLAKVGNTIRVYLLDRLLCIIPLDSHDPSPTGE